MDRQLPQAAGEGMLSRKLTAHPGRMGDFYSCCRLHPRQGRVRNPPWHPQHWHSHAGKLGRGCRAAQTPAAPGNRLPCPLLGPFCHHRGTACVPARGQPALPPGRDVAAAEPRSAQSGKASPLVFNLLWIEAIIIRIISSR